MEKCLSCGKEFDFAEEQKIYQKLIEDDCYWDRSYNGCYCAECERAMQEETYYYDPYD